MEMNHVLVVEDDKEIREGVEIYLKSQGYEVFQAADGVEGLEVIEKEDIHLAIVDIMMPRMDGITMTMKLREKYEFPVIMLSAKSEETDKVIGLNIGADDYITKPFAIEELLARIRVAIKLHRNFNKGTVPEAEDGLLRWGHLTLNEKKHQVTYDNHQISLTNREFQMLKVLLENQDIVLTRDVLLERVCGYDYVGETNVVDVYIRFLRSKIDQVFQVKMIQTIRGVGYVIKSEE